MRSNSTSMPIQKSGRTVPTRSCRRPSRFGFSGPHENYAPRTLHPCAFLPESLPFLRLLSRNLSRRPCPIVLDGAVPRNAAACSATAPRWPPTRFGLFRRGYADGAPNGGLVRYSIGRPHELWIDP